MTYRQKRAEIIALYTQGFFTPEERDQELQAAEYAYGEMQTAGEVA